VDEANPDQNYPNSCLAIKLRSNNMPFNLVETLIKKSENMIKKLATDPEGGKPQVIPVFQFLDNILQNNNLIPAWDELPDIKDILRLEKNSPETEHKDELKMFEKQGKLRIKMRNGAKFFLEIELVVPEAYPYDKPSLKIIDSSQD
jgi:hypothetical protein